MLDNVLDYKLGDMGYKLGDLGYKLGRLRTQFREAVRIGQHNILNVAQISVIVGMNSIEY